VPGESNPADLLTKHSQTAERLAKLVALFGAEFRGGRAAAAPQLRKSEGTKVTMADGNLDLGAVTEEHDPIMPHLVMNAEELDKHYPAMAVPLDNFMTEQDFDDGFIDDNLQRGIREAAEIDAATRRFGRTKYEAMARPGAGAGFAKPAVSVDNMSVDDNSFVHIVLYV
jgi:hypothetical protein